MGIIREKYKQHLALEAELEIKLEKIKRDEMKFEICDAAVKEKSQSYQKEKLQNYEEAMTRNTNISKLLEMTKARLRSRSTFSPLEQILEKVMLNYKKDLGTSQKLENNRQHHIISEITYNNVL